MPFVADWLTERLTNQPGIGGGVRDKKHGERVVVHFHGCGIGTGLFDSKEPWQGRRPSVASLARASRATLCVSPHRWCAGRHITDSGALASSANDNGPGAAEAPHDNPGRKKRNPD